MIRAALLALALVCVAPSAIAQIHSPQPGSVARRAILDAVRPHVEGELGAPVEFVVQTIRVSGDWAFVEATPQRPGGRAIRGRPDMDGVHTEAILRRDAGDWIVIGWAVGATDVWFIDYCGRVPRGLLGGYC